MTEIFFTIVMFLVLGFVSGRIFKGLNPLIMLAGGFVVIAPSALALMTLQSPLYYTMFALGFIFYFGNPLKSVSGSFEEFKLGFLLTKAQEKRAGERLAQEKQIIEEELARQKAQAEEDLNAQRKFAEEELKRQKAQAEEGIRREAERFYREQEQHRKEMAEKASDLNPRKYNDACEILGCDLKASLAELKSAYKTLANLYHPDKVAKFTGKRKKQMEEEFKVIQQAWETVKKARR